MGRKHQRLPPHRSQAWMAVCDRTHWHTPHYRPGLVRPPSRPQAPAHNRDRLKRLQIQEWEWWFGEEWGSGGVGSACLLRVVSCVEMGLHALRTRPMQCAVCKCRLRAKELKEWKKEAKEAGEKTCFGPGVGTSMVSNLSCSVPPSVSTRIAFIAESLGRPRGVIPCIMQLSNRETGIQGKRLTMANRGKFSSGIEWRET